MGRGYHGDEAIPDASCPQRIELMLSTRVGRIPSYGVWHAEPKWDGYRANVLVAGGEAQLRSRQGEYHV